MEGLITTHNGAKFYKVDLHIHTPASKCYDSKCKNVSPEEIVKRALANNLAIIAITDHNSPGWYHKVSRAARCEDLLVLPGVELTCTPGTHLLAIFEPDKSWAVEALLHRAKLPRNQWGDETAYLTWSVETTLREINELGGIAIAPHIDSSRGVLERVYGKKMKVKKILSDHEGQAKAGILRSDYLDGVSITKVETKDFLSILLQQNEHYKREFPLAFLFDSDAHSPANIGKRYSLIKMNKPTFKGLKQALTDSERVLLNQQPTSPLSKIIGFYAEGGFLDEQRFHFNEHLNCIVGGRGSGKSVAITLLRLALDQGFFSEKAAELQQEDHLPNKIHLWLEVGRKVIYIKVDLVEGKRNCYYYEEGQLKLAPSLQSNSWAEVYGPGEIYHIAELEMQQLVLIDKRIRISLKFQEDEIVFIEKERKLSELNSLRDNFDKLVITYNLLKRLYDKANYDLIILKGKAINNKPYEYLKNCLHNFLAIARIIKEGEPKVLPLYEKLEGAYLFIKNKKEQEKSWLLGNLEESLKDLELLRNLFLSHLEVEKGVLLEIFKRGMKVLTTLGDINKKITKWRQAFCQEICSQPGSQFCIEIMPSEMNLRDPVSALENIINYNFYHNPEVIPLEEFSQKLHFKDDSLQFYLKIGNSFKPIEKLSKGQKSVLVLMLLALEERNMPLIIAQPETDLDHDYIFNTMVKMLRKLKNKRQVILTTYNANIAVSADAELILVLESEAEGGRIVKRGSIDDGEVSLKIQEVLEGGVNAFRLRLKKYGYI